MAEQQRICDSRSICHILSYTQTDPTAKPLYTQEFKGGCHRASGSWRTKTSLSSSGTWPVKDCFSAMNPFQFCFPNPRECQNQYTTPYRVPSEDWQCHTAWVRMPLMHTVSHFVTLLHNFHLSKNAARKVSLSCYSWNFTGLASDRLDEVYSQI